MADSTCIQCGVPVPAGAFLGQCPACNDTKSATQTVAVSPGGGSSISGKWIVIGVGGIVMVMVVLATVLFMPSDTVPVEASTVETSEPVK